MNNDGEVKEINTPLWQALIPVCVLASLIFYGLIYRPYFGPLMEYSGFQDPPSPTESPSALPQLPLEIIFILAAAITVAQLLLTGHRWQDIQNTIVAKFQQALPAFLILFCIGMVIASWIVCGTIPMLVYFGLKSIEPAYLYILSFIAPIIFSSLTGTSWGSVGTIGVVLIGIATALDANLAITAGAIIGGAYFGDKLSPLSDTTNMAALGAEVDLYDHIRSMLWTTLPSAVIAAVIYFWMGSVYPPTVHGDELDQLDPFLSAFDSMFRFSWLLLIPPIIVLAGSLFKMPTVPVLISSIVAAVGLAISLQQFSLTDIIASVHKGFDVSMAKGADQVPEKVQVLLNRGGLYELNDPIIIAFMIFIFIGAMDHIKAMPTVVGAVLKSIHSPRWTVLGTLLFTGITNAFTSSQYATSFIIGDAFKSKYDAQGIDRSVLSRSLEDTGTMIESIVPWHPSCVFMVATLSVTWSEFWYWQLLSLINIVVAIFLAASGIGLTQKRKDAKDSLEES